jgi:hypothetical protein
MKKVIDIKDKAAFECEMERRLRLYRHEMTDTYNFVIGCLKDGRPRTKADKRVICETQKLALGVGEKAVALCGKVMPADALRKRCAVPEMAARLRGARYGRLVHLQTTEEEVPFLDRIITAVVEGRRQPLSDDDEGGPPSSGVACAYPGGCD